MNESIEILMKYQTEINRLNEVLLVHEKQIRELNEVVCVLVNTTADDRQAHLALLNVLSSRGTADGYSGGE